MTGLSQQLRQNATLILRGGIFYQTDFAVNQQFEADYIELRGKEKRIYTDEELKSLPKISSNHLHAREWNIRSTSCKNLIRYVAKKQFETILEVGCGNGWLSNQLSSIPQTQVVGLDVNETELTQAARAFAKPNLAFIYGDLFTLEIGQRFDCIVFASSIQYFQNLAATISRSLEMLSAVGEIHIIDSPFYQDDEVGAAKQRTKEYFQSHNTNMTERYFHHSWNALRSFNYSSEKVEGVIGRIVSLGKHFSPFPWIKIKGKS